MPTGVECENEFDEADKVWVYAGCDSESNSKYLRSSSSFFILGDFSGVWFSSPSDSSPKLSVVRFLDGCCCIGGVDDGIWLLNWKLWEKMLFIFKIYSFNVEFREIIIFIRKDFYFWTIFLFLGKSLFLNKIFILKISIKIS
jgi:hypothetical protein